MKINSVSVRFSELRSTGYPTFGNKTCGIELTATLDSGDTPSQARDRLLAHARKSVGAMFDDCARPAETIVIKTSEMDLPF